jgi:hypothetical protein
MLVQHYNPKSKDFSTQNIQLLYFKIYSPSATSIFTANLGKKIYLVRSNHCPVFTPKYHCCCYIFNLNTAVKKKKKHVCICSHPNKQQGCGKKQMNQTEIMREAGERCELYNTCCIWDTACWHVKRVSSACTSLSAQWSYAANDNKEVISPEYYAISIQNYLLTSLEYDSDILRNWSLRNGER